MTTLNAIVRMHVGQIDHDLSTIASDIIANNLRVHLASIYVQFFDMTLRDSCQPLEKVEQVTRRLSRLGTDDAADVRGDISSVKSMLVTADATFGKVYNHVCTDRRAWRGDLKQAGVQWGLIYNFASVTRGASAYVVQDRAWHILAGHPLIQVSGVVQSGMPIPRVS
jgi:hypothetical protein